MLCTTHRVLQRVRSCLAACDDQITRGEAYNEVIPLLAQHNRVIAPDFLGHGYSDKRDFFDRSLLAQTAMIILLMDHLGIGRADFVGS
jgi:pimeloyl-ACP methyl ester carboxylesterase